MGKIIADLLELKERDDSLQNEFRNLNSQKKDEFDAFWMQVIEIVQFKNEIIKSEFAKSSVFIIPDNEVAKSVLEKIKSKQLFFADKFIQSFEQITKTRLDLDKRNFSELYEIAERELLTWFGPAEYIEKLIEIGALVLGVTIPKELESLVGEARQCYAFERYIAVYSLCRAIIEAAMRDICLRTGDIQKIEDTKKFYDKYPAATLIRLVSNDNRQMKERIRELYYTRLSAVVHGMKLTDSRGVQSTFRETLLLVQELYQHNQHRFSLSSFSEIT